MPKLLLQKDGEKVELESENYVYQIKNLKDWIFLINYQKAFLLVNYPGGFVSVVITKEFINNQSYEIKNDIDFENMEMSPWLNFNGTLEGNNKKLSNINIISKKFNGLFGMCNRTTIKNLSINNISINGGNYIGIIIGYAHEATIENIKISGNVKIEGQKAGIICGFFRGDINNIEININQIDKPLFEKFFGCLRNSVINLFFNENSTCPYLCYLFNGFITNCILLSNLKNKIFEIKYDGKVINTQFNLVNLYKSKEKDDDFMNLILLSINDSETDDKKTKNIETDLNNLNENIWNLVAF